MTSILGMLELSGQPLSREVIDALASRLGVAPQARESRSEAGAALLAWFGSGPANHFSDDTVVVVADGAIYNLDELAIADTTGCDAAWVATLYHRHGFAGALQRLNADIAVALYDRRERTLWLGRDRTGTRPMYYAEGDGLFAFASRASALCVLPGVAGGVNQEFVAVFAGLHYRYFDNREGQSRYAGVSQLPAGTVLKVDQSGIRLEPYWDIEPCEPNAGDEAEQAARYRELLLDSVARRLARCKAPAFTLSGGMDSSSVIACAVNGTGAKQIAFSSAYADRIFDERDEIGTILDAVTTAWHPVMIDDFDLLETVRAMVEANDEPVVTATWLSHYLLCQTVGGMGHDALFGGLGGDELNAGEYEYFFFHFADLRHQGRMDAFWHEIDCWVRHHDHPIHRKSRAVALAQLDKVTDPARPGQVRPDQLRLQRYRDTVDPAFFDLASYQPAMDQPFKSWLANRTYQDLRRETTPPCLRHEDRQTRAFGMRNIDPFLDHRIIEFMYRVPGSMKIRDGITKRLLRTAMTGILPEQTRTRITKTGWNAPAHLWFTEGRNADAVRDLIGSQRFRERGIYDVGRIEALLAEHKEIVESGRAVENHMMFFWQLVNLETWLAWRDEA